MRSRSGSSPRAAPTVWCRLQDERCVTHRAPVTTARGSSACRMKEPRTAHGKATEQSIGAAPARRRCSPRRAEPDKHAGKRSAQGRHSHPPTPTIAARGTPDRHDAQSNAARQSPSPPSAATLRPATGAARFRGREASVRANPAASNERALHAATRPDEVDSAAVMSAGDERVGEGERGQDVAGSPATGDEDVRAPLARRAACSSACAHLGARRRLRRLGRSVCTRVDGRC